MEKGMEKGKIEGERSILRQIIQKLKKSGMSLVEVVNTIDFPKSEIEMLWD